MEPWDTAAKQGPPALPDSTTKPVGVGVKEHVLMALLLDQTDESELVPASTEKAQEWVQRYVNTVGSVPEEEEEATDSQLAALFLGNVVLKQAPYCDFLVWTPFGRTALRSQKFRPYVPFKDGSYFSEGVAVATELARMAGILESVQGGDHLPGHCVALRTSTV